MVIVVYIVYQSTFRYFYFIFAVYLLKNLKMRKHPVVLSIAGSDCSGGAGIQADIKTISAISGYAASAITAVTVQNTLGVQNIQTIPAEIVKAQIEAVMDDLYPDALKIGMVNDESTVKAIVNCIKKYKPQFIVYDPVMISTSGRQLITDDALNIIQLELCPLCTLITPNLNEASVLLNKEIHYLDEMKAAARDLSNLYQSDILIKGGHLAGEQATDILYCTNQENYIYQTEKIKSSNLHGTGCTLSAAIATFLAKGYSTNESVAKAKNYITRAIVAGKDLEIGHGNGPLWHFPSDTAQF